MFLNIHINSLTINTKRIMEKNNEKISRAYVAPETEIVEIETGRILEESVLEPGTPKPF